MSRPVVLIGYSGHAFVVADVLRSAGRTIVGYCDRERKVLNPFGLTYFGPEDGAEGREQLQRAEFFVAIGNNRIRNKVIERLLAEGFRMAAVAPDASNRVAESATVGSGTLIAPRVTVNALATIGQGAIINTAAVVEHECHIGDYVHVAPGAVLTGNVSVDTGAFIGAGAVVLPGIHIGEWAVIGAGAVVLRDVSPGCTVYGNPAKPKV